MTTAARALGAVIAAESPRAADIAELLGEHLAHMRTISPPESTHALDLQGLCLPDVTFFAAREGGVLLGCGALREIDPAHGEVKSMRTAAAHLRRGVASLVLERIIAEARARGYTRLSLETGAQDAFVPARRLYERRGFVECDAFAGYRPDPNSVFMTLVL